VQRDVETARERKSEIRRMSDAMVTMTRTATEKVQDFIQDDDEVLDVSGVRVFVDPFSAQYLAGVEIDYVSSMMGQGFTFRNPNASGGCGCGSSFTV
jgi:iron-sulfur cluster assembly accessory protein